MAYYSQGHFVKKKKMRGERPRVTVRQHCQQESCKTGEGGVLQSEEDNGLKQRTNACYRGKRPKC